jgi:hypothetical protein
MGLAMGIALTCAVIAPAASASPGLAARPVPGSHATADRPGVTMRPSAATRPALSAAARAFEASPAGRALLAGEQRAASAAVTTGKPVAVASATTSTSVLVAQPDGRFRQVTTVEPTRFQRGGAWVGIDTTLHRTASGWAARSVPGQVSLSAGGTGPAATLTAPSGGRTTLKLPYALGSPAISGSTATYPTSIPGVSLRLTVTPQGGVDESLTEPARAITGVFRAALARAAIGGSATPAGTWLASSPADRAAFRLSSPVIARTPLAEAMIAARARTAAQAAQVLRSSQASQQVLMTVSPQALTGCSSAPGQECDSGGHWNVALQGDPDPDSGGSAGSLWDVAKPYTYGLPIGNEGVYGCSGTCQVRDRAFFQIPLSLTSGMLVSSSRLWVDETYGSDWNCSDPWSAQLWWTNGISSATDWASQPGNAQASAVDTLYSVLPGYNPQNSSNNGGPCRSSSNPFTFSFNTLPVMTTAAANNWTSWTVKIVGDEAASADPSGSTTGDCASGLSQNKTVNGLSPAGYNCGYMEISANPEIISYFDMVPPAPDNLAVQSPPSVSSPGTYDNGCGTSLNRPPYVPSRSVTLQSDVHSAIAGEQALDVYHFSDYNKNAPAAYNGAFPVAGNLASPVADGTSVTISPTGLTPGDEYFWGASSETFGVPWGQNSLDGGTLGLVVGPASQPCRFIVDDTTPPVPTLTGVHPNWVPGQSGPNSTLTLTVAAAEAAPTGCGFSPCFDSGIYQYEYSLNGNQLSNSCINPNNPNNPTKPAINDPTAHGGCWTADGLSSTGPTMTSYTGSIISAALNGSQGTPGLTTTMCLDDYHGGTATGTVVDIYRCNNTTSQSWTYASSSGELQINGVCAEATGDAKTAGTLIELAPCSASTAGENWAQGTGGSFVNHNSGLCLAAPSTNSGTQLTLAACTTSGTAGALQNWANSTAAITIPVNSWGVNSIYLKAMTGAGVASSSYSVYSFYVPYEGTATLGDVTGDATPDLLATGSDGNLYVYPGQAGNTSLGAPVVASPAGDSPALNGYSPLPWNDFTITHRGEDSGVFTDDLYAWPTIAPPVPPATNGVSGVLWRYANSDATGTLTGSNYINPANETPVNDPGNSVTPSTTWQAANPTQLLAVGNPLSSVTDSLPGLLTIEGGNLYYYQSRGSGTLAPGIELGTGWGNMTLIAPGMTGPQHQMELWARDNNTGNLYAYHFYQYNGLLSLSSSAATIGPEGSGATQVTLPSGVSLTKAAYPTIASAGDGNGDYTHPALYAVNTSGQIMALAISLSPATDASDLSSSQPSVAGTAPSGVTLKQIS